VKVQKVQAGMHVMC